MALGASEREWSYLGHNLRHLLPPIASSVAIRSRRQQQQAQTEPLVDPTDIQRNITYIGSKSAHKVNHVKFSDYGRDMVMQRWM